MGRVNQSVAVGGHEVKLGDAGRRTDLGVEDVVGSAGSTSGVASGDAVGGGIDSSTGSGAAQPVASSAIDTIVAGGLVQKTILDDGANGDASLLIGEQVGPGPASDAGVGYRRC